MRRFGARGTIHADRGGATSDFFSFVCPRHACLHSPTLSPTGDVRPIGNKKAGVRWSREVMTNETVCVPHLSVGEMLRAADRCAALAAFSFIHGCAPHGGRLGPHNGVALATRAVEAFRVAAANVNDAFSVGGEAQCDGLVVHAGVSTVGVLVRLSSAGPAGARDSLAEAAITMTTVVPGHPRRVLRGRVPALSVTGLDGHVDEDLCCQRRRYRAAACVAATAPGSSTMLCSNDGHHSRDRNTRFTIDRTFDDSNRNSNSRVFGGAVLALIAETAEKGASVFLAGQGLSATVIALSGVSFIAPVPLSVPVRCVATVCSVRPHTLVSYVTVTEVSAPHDACCSAFVLLQMNGDAAAGLPVLEKGPISDVAISNFSSPYWRDAHH